MIVPAGFSFFIGEAQAGRVYLLSATILMTLTAIIAIAMLNRKPKSSGRLHLITLLMAYLFIPLICALPFSNLVPEISISQAYFEMMSSFTTTGASMFEEPSDLSKPLHLWRSIVGWYGGFFILVAAVSIMEPLNLGGFEIRSRKVAPSSGLQVKSGQSASPSDRIIRSVRTIAPLYVFLTGLLTLFLVVLGDNSFVAVSHAMAILSTSGISPVGGLEQSQAGILGEFVIFVFFIFALSHRFFITKKGSVGATLISEPELRIAILVALVVSLLLFLFHFIGIASDGAEFTFLRAFYAWWGGLFTSLSFITTTGFVSDHWALAKVWANLNGTGLILLSLTIMGGGIATTAGGVKLLRIYVLYKHGERELTRLVHPSSIAGFGTDARHIRREGAYVTWMFVMLFVLSIAGISLALSLCGLEFESAFVLAIASLSNNGPLAAAFGGEIESYGSLTDNARMYLDISMIIGRMEVLAVVALLNPSLWRL